MTQPETPGVAVLRDFVNARLAEDESWATAANRPYRYADPGSVAPPGGVHWTWVVGENWTPVDPDPVTEDYVGEHHPDGGSTGLATVEEWPSTSRWDGPPAGEHVHMMREKGLYGEEVDPAWAGLIVRNGPAQVLARVAGARALTAWLDALLSATSLPYGVIESGWRRVAAMWADHPDYRPEWSVRSHG